MRLNGHFSNTVFMKQRLHFFDNQIEVGTLQNIWPKREPIDDNGVLLM